MKTTSPSASMAADDAVDIAQDSQAGEDLLSKLTAELLNDILEFALVAPSSIEISRKGTYNHQRSTEGTLLKTKKLEHTVRAMVAVSKGKKVKRLPMGNVVGIGLLGASTSIRAIALRMIFGLNKFHFTRENAVELFFATVPIARNLVRHVDILAANIRYLSLGALRDNTALESLKITIAHSGNKSSRPASRIDVWQGVARFVRGGATPQQEKQRFDLITFDIKDAPVDRFRWDQGFSDLLDENEHKRFKDKLLRMWGSTIYWEEQDKYPFMPEGVNWKVFD